MINDETTEGALESEVFDNVFEMWWPKLKVEIEKKLNETVGNASGETRSDRDILEEVLALNREIARDRRGSREISPGALDDLVDTYVRILEASAEGRVPPSVRSLLEQMRLPIEHFAMSSVRRRMNRKGGAVERAVERIDELIPMLGVVGSGRDLACVMVVKGRLRGRCGGAVCLVGGFPGGMPWWLAGKLVG